jgi:hypothetical protein
MREGKEERDGVAGSGIWEDRGRAGNYITLCFDFINVSE